VKQVIECSAHSSVAFFHDARRTVDVLSALVTTLVATRLRELYGCAGQLRMIEAPVANARSLGLSRALEVHFRH
jgi:hypothetical protein